MAWATLAGAALRPAATASFIVDVWRQSLDYLRVLGPALPGRIWKPTNGRLHAKQSGQAGGLRKNLGFNSDKVQKLPDLPWGHDRGHRRIRENVLFD